MSCPPKGSAGASAPGEAHAGAAGPIDSGGVPWADREVTSHAFAGDDGSADPALREALHEGRPAEVVAAVRAARWLVPVTASPKEPGQDHAEMATVLLRGRDGSVALPAFSSTEALAAWRGEARPVPVDASTLAAAALQEGCDVVALDLAGPTPYRVPEPVLRALAANAPWIPPAEDPVVGQEVALALAGESEIRAHLLRGGDELCDLIVELALRPGLGSAELYEILGRIGARLAVAESFRERVIDLAVTVVPG